MHGGCVATIIDVTTSLLMLFQTDFATDHVSINLTTSFLKAINSGETVYALAKVSKKGKKVWFFSCELFNEREELCYEGTHIKTILNKSKRMKSKMPKL